MRHNEAVVLVRRRGVETVLLPAGFAKVLGERMTWSRRPGGPEQVVTLRQLGSFRLCWEVRDSRVSAVLFGGPPARPPAFLRGTPHDPHVPLFTVGPQVARDEVDTLCAGLAADVAGVVATLDALVDLRGIRAHLERPGDPGGRRFSHPATELDLRLLVATLAVLDADPRGSALVGALADDLPDHPAVRHLVGLLTPEVRPRAAGAG